MADDSNKQSTGKKNEAQKPKFNAAQFFTTAFAEYLQIYVEDPKNKIPGLDAAVRTLRQMGLGSSVALAGIDGTLKTVVRNAPGLPDNVRDLGEELVDMLFDRVRYFPPNGTKQQAEDDFRIGRVKADAVLEAWKKNSAKLSFAAIELKMATGSAEDKTAHAELIDWLRDMKRWMPKSYERWEVCVDKIESVPRVKLVLAQKGTSDKYPNLDPEDMSDGVPMSTDEFHAEWATTQARLEYLEGIFKPTWADQAKQLGKSVVALVLGEETPATRRLTKRIGAFTSEADAFTKRQEDAITASDKKNGVKKYLLPLWFVALVCVLIFVALAGLLLTSAN